MSEESKPGPDVATETSTEAKRQENTKARIKAGEVLEKKVTQITKKVDREGTAPDKLPPGERVLYGASLLRDGYGEDFDYGAGFEIKKFNADESSDTLTVKNEDGSTSVDITKITGEKRATDGTLMYVCKTPAGKDVEIPVADLLAAHTEKNATAIADTFDNVEQAALVEWAAKNDGSDCPISSDQVDAIVVDTAGPKENDTQQKIDQFISEQIDDIEMQIARLKVNEADPNIALQDQLAALLKECKIATFLQGDGGIFYKEQLLKKISLQRTSEGAQGRATVAQIDEHLAAMREEDGLLETAEGKLMDIINEGMPNENQDARVKALMERIDNGDALAVLQETDVNALEGMNEFLYRNPDITANVINNLLKFNSVDEATKAKLELAKKGGLSLLVILLALPAAAVAAAFEGVALLGKLNR